MDHRGFQALELLGLTLMQTIKFRESYAFVAQVGAAAANWFARGPF